MTLRREWKPLLIIAAGFVVCYWLPVEQLPVPGAFSEALKLMRWYAREHVLTCLIPAFFIAGAIAVFISKAAVMRYLGAGANKVLAYGVAAVSGTILAVCSCTVLPLFAGIYGMGAGLGPATAFLYSGPAINVLAIILTARVLGVELGLARAICAIVFSVVIGLLVPEAVRPLWQAGLYFAAMVAVLIFANWGGGAEGGFFAAVYEAKWLLTAGAGLLLGVMLVLWFRAVWWEILLVALVTAVTALVWPAYPAVPFSVSVIGLVVLTVRKPGELREWTSETDNATAVCWRAGGGIATGHASRRGTDPFGLGGGCGGWQLGGCQPVRRGGRCVDVFRHPDGGANPGRADERRYGLWASTGVALGGASAQPAEHAGHRARHGLAQDPGVLWAGSVSCGSKWPGIR